MKECGGTRVLIHYGGGSAVRSGLLSRVCASLDKEGIFHTELGGVVPNPRISKVREGIAIGLEQKLDFILAVGGGSVIDSCKAIAYGLAEPEKDVWELYDHKRKASGCLPVGAVVTIAAAGSEMSNSSVITDEATGEKRSCNDDIARPKFAVMNPELTVTLPPYQTAAGCADIMMHTMERYFVPGDTLELTDEIAEGLLMTVMKNAEILRDDPANLKELGIAPTEEQILAMAASCSRDSGGKKGNARVLYEKDMAEIYRMANQGQKSSPHRIFPVRGALS